MPEVPVKEREKVSRLIDEAMVPLSKVEVKYD
jgi:hypothetical protein